ncbi:MAG: putative metalloprotease CJM1_0395 family protein [Pseudomonadota bacterium]
MDLSTASWSQQPLPPWNPATQEALKRGAQVNSKTEPGEPPTAQENAAVRPQSAEPDQQQTREQANELRELKVRDQEVRQHENAHRSAGGGLVRGGSYEYTRGPDGRMYAIAGEVSIDSGSVPGDPEATLQKAQTVLRAALAPAEPSGQDRRVAAQAQATAAQARLELMQKRARGEEGQAPGGVVDVRA